MGKKKREEKHPHGKADVRERKKEKHVASRRFRVAQWRKMTVEQRLEIIAQRLGLIEEKKA